MIQLFVKTGCQHCERTIATFNSHGVPYEEKNVSDPDVVNELIALGGKKQEPFLVDGDVHMYESADIIDYIERTYGKEGVPKRPKIHFATDTDVCPS